MSLLTKYIVKFHERNITMCNNLNATITCSADDFSKKMNSWRESCVELLLSAVNVVPKTTLIGNTTLLEYMNVLSTACGAVDETKFHVCTRKFSSLFCMITVALHRSR